MIADKPEKGFVPAGLLLPCYTPDARFYLIARGISQLTVTRKK